MARVIAVTLASMALVATIVAFATTEQGQIFIA